MRLALFILMFSLTTAVAIAEPISQVNGDQCFTNSFSPGYLKDRPRQTVTALAVHLFRQNPETDPTVYMNMDIEIGKKTYKAFMLCDRSESGLDCAVECDGGRVQLKNLENGGIEIHNQGFLMSASCGQSQEAQEEWLAPTENGDDLFSLESAECSAMTE